MVRRAEPSKLASQESSTSTHPCSTRPICLCTWSPMAQNDAPRGLLNSFPKNARISPIHRPPTSLELPLILRARFRQARRARESFLCIRVRLLSSDVLRSNLLDASNSPPVPHGIAHRIRLIAASGHLSPVPFQDDESLLVSQ